MKKLYYLMRDGDLLPDTHVFAFYDILTAILTLYLFSVTFASKDIKLFCIGDYKDGIFRTYDTQEFVCDFYNGVNLVNTIRNSNPDKFKNNVVTADYLNQIISDVDKAIEYRFKGE